MFRNIMTSIVVIIDVSENIMTRINEQLMGQFLDEKKNGKGTFYYANGNKYIGDFVDDEMAGQGVFTWPDGNRYEMKCSEMSWHHLL